MARRLARIVVDPVDPVDPVDLMARHLRCHVIRHSPRHLTLAWPNRQVALRPGQRNKAIRNGPGSIGKPWTPA